MISVPCFQLFPNISFHQTALHLVICHFINGIRLFLNMTYCRCFTTNGQNVANNPDMYGIFQSFDKAICRRSHESLDESVEDCLYRNTVICCKPLI